MGYQFFLPMVLRWRASRAEAPLLKYTPSISLTHKSTSLIHSHVLGRHSKKKLMLCCAVLKAAKYEKQRTGSWCYVSSSSPCAISSLSVSNNRERVNFGQQILALLLVHSTHNLSCIKFAHISPQVQGLCILSSSPHETFHIATNVISIGMKKQQELPLATMYL